MRILGCISLLLIFNCNLYSQITTKLNVLGSNVSDYKLYGYLRGEFYKINTPTCDSLLFLKPEDTLFSLMLVTEKHFYSFGLIRSRDIMVKDLVALNFDIDYLNSCCFNSFLYRGITGVVYGGTRGKERKCNKLDIIIYPK
jgi:hypothetical protein